MAKHILVVDDDADIRQAAELVLTSAGYKVSFAASAEEAMQKLQAAGADLVLLDVMMETDTAGFHLSYDIRKDAKLKGTPIVMLTSIEDRLGVQRVVMVADNDAPGLLGAERVARDIGLTQITICPPCKDLREFVNCGGTRGDIETMVKQQVWRFYDR